MYIIHSMFNSAISPNSSNWLIMKIHPIFEGLSSTKNSYLSNYRWTIISDFHVVILIKTKNALFVPVNTSSLGPPN